MRIRSYRHCSRPVGAAALLGLAAALAIAAGPASAAGQATRAAVTPLVRCVTANAYYNKRAIKMAHDIESQLSGRVSTEGLQVTDGHTGITCTYHATTHFIAASVVKVTILAALLRKLEEEHKALSASQKRLAWLMITQSSNSAATALWDEVGLRGMQHFLDLAGMRQTRLSDAWGLTLLTAHDEIALLKILTSVNMVLAKPDRIYARYLMARVIPSQRWGVPAGAPLSVGVHVKNGWLPYPRGGPWEINSIGAFTSAHRVYMIVMLTYHNPSMIYGIDTIEDAAEVMHRNLNPRVHQVIGPTPPFPSWGVPDDQLP
jgi:Beta-lactamase enzyme family